MNFFENCNYSCLWRSAFTQKHAFSNIWKYFRPSALTLWWPQVTSVSNKHCWGHSSMLWCLVAQAPPKSLFCRLEVSLSNNVWRYTCLKFELFSPKKCIWKPLGGQRVNWNSLNMMLFVISLEMDQILIRNMKLVRFWHI